MNAAWWIGAGLAGSLGLFIIVFNWARNIINYRNSAHGRKRFVSGVPLIVPMLVCVAISLAPIRTFADRVWWLWAPWILDEQTWLLAWLLVIVCIPALRRRYFASPRSSEGAP